MDHARVLLLLWGIYMVINGLIVIVGGIWVLDALRTTSPKPKPAELRPANSPTSHP